jgi:hypothetical protein
MSFYHISRTYVLHSIPECESVEHSQSRIWLATTISGYMVKADLPGAALPKTNGLRGRDGAGRPGL